MTEPNEPDEKDLEKAKKIYDHLFNWLFLKKFRVPYLAQVVAGLRAETDIRVKQKEQDIYKKCKKITVDEVLNVPSDKSAEFCVGWGCACRAILETIKKAADKAREE